MVIKPCADDFLQIKDKYAQSLKQAGEGHSDEKDGCSPFCYCACCAVRTLAYTDIKVDFYNPSVPLTISLHSSGFPKSAMSNIWQPPKAD